MKRATQVTIDTQGNIYEPVPCHIPPKQEKEYLKNLALILFLITTFTLSAQDSATRVTNFNITNGVAIQGYDPVSYFTKGMAEVGAAKYAVSYLGVKYYFSSQANRELFKTSPSKYEPQYGGWCAFAMGDSGEKVEINPTTFKIVNNKLYLFYNAFFNNTLKSWNKDELKLKSRADKNWGLMFK